MNGCRHNVELGFTYPCVTCDPTPDDERLRSIGFTFAGGRAAFNAGPTVREQVAEIHENARRNGIDPQKV